MQQFKVGDWVVLLGQVYQIQAISKDSMKVLLDTKEYPRADNWWNTTQCELWQPKEWEWCWFWDNITPHRPTLRKFGCIALPKYGEDKAVFWDSEQNPFTNCAPFQGELPSFLKEYIC